MSDRLKGSLPYKEIEGNKIFYRGKYRIVAQIVNTLWDKEPLGFFVMDESSKRIKKFKTSEVLFLIGKYPFVNAEIHNDKIRCTEGKIENLMKFNLKGQRLSEPMIMILGEKFKNSKDEEREFKILNADLKVLPGFFKESEVVKMIHMAPFSGMKSIVNAKNRADNVIVANVTSNNRDAEDVGFVKIVEDDTDKKIKEKEKHKEWIRERHKKKLIEMAPKILFNSLRHSELSGYAKMPSATISRGLEIKILIEELYKKDLERESFDKYDEVMKYVKKIQNRSDGLLAYEKDCMFIAVYQYILLYPNVRENFIKYSKKRMEARIFKSEDAKLVEDESIYRFLIGRNVISKTFKSLVEELNKELEKEKIEQQRKESKKRKLRSFDVSSASHFLCVTSSKQFKKAKEIAELGFCVHEKYKGEHYESSYGRNYTLKFIGDYIPNYKEYFKMANSFGDVACIAQIERAIETKQSRSFIEILFGILAIYRPDIAKKYWDERLSNIDVLNGILPDFDYSENRDYGLSSELKLYYDSGFNAFYLDKDFYYQKGFSNRKKAVDFYNAYKEYYEKCHKEPFVVLRARFGNMGGKWNNRPKVKNRLFSELVAILGLITSDECEVDFIEENIGYLRLM